MLLLAIDPGTLESGFVVFDGERVHRSGVLPNEEMLRLLPSSQSDALAIEMVASYGMAVGREVFDTCVWIGRFQQAWREPGKVRLVFRREVKSHLCGSMKAKDGNIRQALIDAYGVVGTKKAPGPLYGVKSHAWAALGVAATVLGSA